MRDWFRASFGFSAVGLVFLLCLFVPNILYGLKQPAWQAGMSAAEPAYFRIPERIGEILVSVLLLCMKDLRWPTTWTANVWWFAAAAVLMALYLAAWARYFAGAGTPEDFYGPLLGVPIPLALLPVAAAILLGIYARSFWLIFAGAVLGFGHLGIHILHLRTLGGE